jgi:hypothetical protein
MLYTDNLVKNGSLMRWDTNTPADMDAQTTNTTLLRLQTRFNEENGQRRAWTELAGTHGDKFVYSGHSSLRATLAAAASAQDFRLGPEGMSLTAFTGTVPAHIKTNYGSPGTEGSNQEGGLDIFRFSFAARSDQSDATVELRIILRNNADGVELYLQDGTLPEWAAADTARNSFLLGPRWQVFGVTFQPPIGNANDVIENFVWELSNGVAGAQIIDVDEIRVENLQISKGAR